MEVTKNFKISVIPNASLNEVVGELADGTLKVKLQVPATEGRANVALVELLSKHFNIHKRNIHITSGEKSRIKIIEVIN